MPLPALIGMAARVAGGAGEVAGMAGATSSASALGDVGGKLGQLANISQTATPTLGKFNAALDLTGHKVAELTTTFTRALTVFVRGIDDAAKPIEALVRLANPAQADAFQRAIKDAYAVIGRSLIPIMEAFTRSARKIGDAMAGLEPIMEPAMKKLAEFVDELSTGIAKAIADSPETFKLLSSAIQMAVEQTKVWIPLLEQQAQIMNMMMAPENLIFGSGKGPGFDKNATSAGAAARGAQFVQPKQIADDMIKNALNMGVGAKQTDNQALNSIDETLKKIQTGFEKWWNRNADTVDKAAQTVSPAYGIWKRLTG